MVQSSETHKTYALKIVVGRHPKAASYIQSVGPNEETFYPRRGPLQKRYVLGAGSRQFEGFLVSRSCSYGMNPRRCVGQAGGHSRMKVDWNGEGR